MSSPFIDAFSQRAEKVSTALNEGSADAAAYQLRGMVEDDPLQAERLIRAAIRTTAPDAIDQIREDRYGNVYIINRSTEQLTFAGTMGSHGRGPEPCTAPPETAITACPTGDAPVQPNPARVDYQIRHPFHFRRHCMRPLAAVEYGNSEYPLPPQYTFSGPPRPYYPHAEDQFEFNSWRNHYNFQVRI